MVQFKYLNVSRRISFHSAGQLNAAMPAASLSETNGTDSSLDKRNIRLIRVVHTSHESLLNFIIAHNVS